MIQANDVRVDALDGGTVQVDGYVDNWSEEQAVAQAVWSAPGVRKVEDSLAIMWAGGVGSASA